MPGLARAKGSRLLQYVEKIDGDITGLAAATDLAGMALSFTTDGRPFYVWFDALIRNPTAGGIAVIQLLQRTSTGPDVYTGKLQKQGFANAANQTFPASGRRRFTGPAGLYVFKLQGAPLVAGTCTVFATDGTPLVLGAEYA